MGRPKRRVLALFAQSLTAVTFAACSAAPEQPILSHYFTASRLRDNTTLGAFSTVAFEPDKQGIVNSFSITAVSPERRKALNLKALAKAQEEARAEDQAFTKRKEEYATQNSDVLQKVVRAGRDAKLKGKEAEVQAAWYKLVDEGVEISRKITNAKRTLAAESGVVDLSVSDPGNPIDLAKVDGELVSKDVTIDADVKLPNGQTRKKTLVVTLQRAELTGDKPRTGRWIVTQIKEASASPATPRS
jgi:hypothetical protein